MDAFDFNQLIADYENKVANAELLAKQLTLAVSEIEQYKQKLSTLWKPNVDYSFISSELLRAQMEDDSRRMSIARMGFKGHSRAENFSEFCGYAFLQIEGCLDYLYSTISNDDITRFNSIRKAAYDLHPDPYDFSDVTHRKYGNMFNLLNKELDLFNKHKPLYYSVKNIENYRNTKLFHRGIVQDSNLKDWEKSSLASFIAGADFGKTNSTVENFVELVRQRLQQA